MTVSKPTLANTPAAPKLPVSLLTASLLHFNSQDDIARALKISPAQVSRVLRLQNRPRELSTPQQLW
jgi:hypothetical protein